MTKRIILLSAIIFCVITGLLFFYQTGGGGEAPAMPNDWFVMQRAFPYHEINYGARNIAWEQVQQIRQEARFHKNREEGWVFSGPLNIGGRISAVAMHPADIQTIYAGAAAGGVFRSEDGGESWTAIFDDAMSLSIGDIAVAPSDPGIIYVGTGEANAGGGSLAYDGNGIYRSGDSGSTWEHLGLSNSGSVGRIVVDPTDPQKVFVAAMGRLFSNNQERGVFRSVDGGVTWENVLFVSDSTGAIDLVIHPDHPDTIYVAMWERIRRPDRRNYGGSTCGIYRTYNGGDTWTQLTSGLPAPGPTIGRIGIDISEADPKVLYAIYADNLGYFLGVFKTVNGGDLWVRTNDAALSNMYSSYGWWFGRISVDPVNPNVAYAIGFDLYKTLTGGSSWQNISGSSVHVDQHDLVAHPQDPSFLVLGNDGGIYLSGNAGNSWTHLKNLPITQFYTCELDEQYPERLYGGTQDNGTNRTMTGGLDNWTNIYGGDGFYVLVDPVNNLYVYAEYQYGNLARSVNGGTSFQYAMNGIDGGDRKNWNTPVVFDPSDPSVLYYGSDRLYRSSNRALSWSPISSDLTNGTGTGNLVYGTITTIAVAPSNNQFIYVGTDDGNVWRTGNGGSEWTSISSSLPERWVTRVAVDPYDEHIVYVTLSGYRYDSYLPHVFRSTDAGTSWTDISGDLPEAPVNDIVIDPIVDSALYLATDFGVFVTWDLGDHWSMIGDNLPNVPVVDLDFHAPTRKLVAATYGRSMYTFDVDQMVSADGPALSGLRPFKVYPNPASGYLYLDCLPQSIDNEYIILSTSGRLMARGKLTAGQNGQIIKVGSLSPGAYLFRFRDGNATGSARFIRTSR